MSEKLKKYLKGLESAIYSNDGKFDNAVFNDFTGRGGLEENEEGTYEIIYGGKVIMIEISTEEIRDVHREMYKIEENEVTEE